MVLWDVAASSAADNYNNAADDNIDEKSGKRKYFSLQVIST